ncbi:unnamed protein product, partial [Oppiella nova]
TFDKFCSSIDTKHKIFTNLDQLTRKLDYKLDYFVVFSSVTCGKGNAGQTNYSFGNSMCERICEQRRRDGLHGLAVQYGPIGDVGVFEGSDQLITLTSIRKQRINSCCDVLDKLLAINTPIVTSFVKANKQRESGNREKRIIGELWRALGIDPDNTPDHLTLGEIGLESMFAVEFQQEMEREWNTKVSLNHVKSITIGMLKEYQSGKLDNIKKHVDDMKLARDHLLKQKYIIPVEIFIRLNGVTVGKPVYLLPTFMLNFAVFEGLAQKLNRPVIGLNWTPDVSKCTTLKDVIKYYVKLLKNLDPNGKYDVVGCLDTAYVCPKVLMKGMADMAVIIDLISDVRYFDDQLNEDLIFEFIFVVMYGELPVAFKDKVLREIKKEQDTKARVKLIANEIADFAGKGLVATDMEEMLYLMIARIRMLSEYRLNKRKKFSNRLKLAIAKKWAKKTGKLIMVKPVKHDSVDDVDVIIEKSCDLYFLPGSSDENSTVQVESVSTQTTRELLTIEVMNKLEAILK